MSGDMLHHVIMSEHGRVAHLENEDTSRPMCGVEADITRRIGLLAIKNIGNPCRVCVEVARAMFG